MLLGYFEPVRITVHMYEYESYIFFKFCTKQMETATGKKYLTLHKFFSVATVVTYPL